MRSDLSTEFAMSPPELWRRNRSVPEVINVTRVDRQCSARLANRNAPDHAANDQRTPDAVDLFACAGHLRDLVGALDGVDEHEYTRSRLPQHCTPAVPRRAVEAGQAVGKI
jgi:hypothetical protein